MHQISRRQFAAAGLAALAASKVSANPLGLPVGCQTYPVRDRIEKDFAGLLHDLRQSGYQNIEMCNPVDYATGGYGSLKDVPGADLKKMIHDAGLTCTSSHFHFKGFKEDLDQRIEWAKGLGLEQMVCSTFSVPATAPLSAWVQAAHDLNAIAEKIAKAGMRTGFHNHAFEFKELDGVLIYDKLMAELDPKLVGMQFQVSVINQGFEAAKFFEKYPGRFLSMHVQDVSTEKKQVAVGQGIVDWKKTFGAAKKAGVKNYFVEMNMDALKASAPYLHSLSI